MYRTLWFLALAALSAGPVLADSPAGVKDAAGLTAALTKASKGDTVTLGADIQWPGPRPLSIPAGVTLDGVGHTITNQSNGALLEQKGAEGVVIRRTTLVTEKYMAWTIAVRNGDLRLEDCDIRCRMIAWQGGAIVLDGCRATIRFPAGNDNNGPVGVYGGGARFEAANCLFVFGYEVRHVDVGLFHNFGGSPASRLSLDHCTVIGLPDPNPSEAGRHLSVFRSTDDAGPGYETVVTDSIILAEVRSVFRSRGKGKVVSSHNNNAGMLRNPGILAGGAPDYTRFYGDEEETKLVLDRSGDIEEPNPFVNAVQGDYRLAAGTKSTIGARDGGPMGARLGVVPVEMNAYNLDFGGHAAVEHRTHGYRETLFDGWLLHRESDQQHCQVTRYGLHGQALRLETLRNDEGVGGPGRLLTQSASQSFVTVPGWTYSIRVSTRRGPMPLVGQWEQDGADVQTILGVSDGHVLQPTDLIASVSLDGPRDQWHVGELEVVAPSTRMTVHLIHRTSGAWNHVDFADLSISPRAPLNAEIPKGLRGPVLGYINQIPPESDAARAARHRKVAERRANAPIIIHRGAHKFEPENTLESYDGVMALGADGVEFDPRRTRDGVLYTFHDPDLGRMLSGGGRGSELTYYEVLCRPFKSLKGHATKQTRVPTVLSLFELARKRAMLLHFDVKEPGIEDELITLLDRFDMWDHMVFVTPSPDSDRLRFHPKARLMDYKQNVDYTNSESVQRALSGPGQMFYLDADPTPAVKALGRKAPGHRPLPDSVRAWWWPDGTSVPLQEINKQTR